ncbi:hypothetical protein [Planosporangium flavigriseum]|uniref:Uncharacterized protein n=1 Tax=Planosporangium flavigriseum TaxID=373681 RepID=A0A8J3LMS0_9ACTN|nr:hypothetical protein [Planosporangium flavigriseum]GIG74174.1 hypothetical protein Pfl04_25780 [Planosporangium flavigriseum]
MTVNVEAVRAEALFVSSLQLSDRPAPDEVLRAVATTLRRFGMRGCAVRVAGEFGEHPETAVGRMEWALEMIRTAYPTPAKPAALRPSQPQPLALAG